MEALGVVLAAGAGRRMGGPKALLRDTAGRTWAARTAEALRSGGCTRVAVTLGAAAADVRRTLPPGVVGIDVPGWEEGVGAGVRAALDHAGGTDADVLVLVPVDLPGLGAGDVAAVLAAAASAPASALVRATWRGRGGHPVLLGRDRWPAARAAAEGDTGLRAFLTAADGVIGVPRSSALADVDVPGDLPPGTRRPAAT